MAEKLNSINVLDFSRIAELRGAIIAIIQEHIQTNNYKRNVVPGDEFYFVKANSFVIPTPYVAWDLAEFRDCIAKSSLNSLFFHLFEARLRLEHPSNDFSFWLGENFEENELAAFIARQDPFIYTLEQIRRTILSAVEERIRSIKR
jgi:hypothetical protein